MPRYSTIKKKKGALPYINPWLRAGIIVVAVLLFIAIATFAVRRLAKNVPLVYGGVVEDQFLSKRALVGKVTVMQSTLTAYDAEITSLTQLQDENAALKAELGRTTGAKGILANVITLPNRSFYDTMTIDAGSAEGIKENMIAYAFGSVALGTVSAVTSHTATVWLYSASGRQTAGNAVGSGVAVTLIGRGSAEYEVQLPRDVPLEVGANVAAQSIEPATIATVEKVITDPRDPFQRLLAKAPVNLQALKWVIVK